jgi:hypothetical protein
LNLHRLNLFLPRLPLSCFVCVCHFN